MVVREEGGVEWRGWWLGAVVDADASCWRRGLGCDVEGRVDGVVPCII